MQGAGRVLAACCLLIPRVDKQQDQQNQGDRRDEQRDDGHDLVLLLPALVPRGPSCSCIRRRSILQLTSSKYQHRNTSSGVHLFLCTRHYLITELTKSRDVYHNAKEIEGKYKLNKS
jgi:hypothetical protein